MSGAYESELWFRVARLTPRLRAQVRLHRTIYRGQVWHVMQDRGSGRFHRFSPEAQVVISLLDGHRDMDTVWRIAQKELPEGALSQDDILRLLAQLHGADVLLGDVPPDLDEMLDRGRKTRRKKVLQSVMNPLALRIPMLDPDGFLTATAPLVRWIFSPVGLLLYLALLAWGLSRAVVEWEALTTNSLDRLLTAESLVLLLIAYPIVKLIHELGHAYAIKRWGGEVHEVGLMFLVFLPLPYVDASDSLAFSSKWRRATVAGAGILVELGLAAIAMIVWSEAEGGLTRAFAFNVMLIGGVSTLLFNGNPLLRFDGYFVLSDLLEIPNLAQRANKYLGYLIKRYLLGLDRAQNPATAPGEPFWFVTYALAAFAYRIFITIAILLLVSSRFFAFGIVLAIWAVILTFGVPLAKHLHFLFTAPALRRKRGRAIGVAALSVAALAALLFAVRLPQATVAQGIVTVDGDRALHAAVAGSVIDLAVPQGAEVATGDVLLHMADPLLDARVALLEATARERRLRLAAAATASAAAAATAREALTHAEADLALARERRDALTLRATAPGRVVWTDPRDLPGRFLQQGDLVGYVTTFRDPVIRAVVPEADADLVRSATRSVDLRFASRPETIHPVASLREVPELGAALPSLALAGPGGGPFVLDPASREGDAPRAIGNLLQMELTLAAATSHDTIGERVYVRFRHPPSPLAARLWRRGRQVFLDRFGL